MKATRKFLIMLATVPAFLIGCSSPGILLDKASVPPCTDNTYTRTTSFTNVTGKVVKRTMTGINPSVTIYYVSAPEVNVDNRLPIYPCNLPENAKKDGLEIRFSGHFVTYPGFELLNLEAYPFELTEISLPTDN